MSKVTVAFPRMCFASGNIIVGGATVACERAGPAAAAAAAAAAAEGKDESDEQVVRYSLYGTVSCHALPPPHGRRCELVTLTARARFVFVGGSWEGRGLCLQLTLELVSLPKVC